jgi:thiol:disulfide interchange protein DsbC
VKKLSLIILAVLFLFPACAGFRDLPSVTRQFKEVFPKNNFESINSTEVNGVYEVYTDNGLYYYLPEGDVIFYGDLVSKNGINITRESYSKKLAEKMAKLPLDSALKIGSGKTAVVEFMDPNCYHCRLAYEFFSKRQDVTVYVFFFPLSKDSGDKIRHILCSTDSVKTYHAVLTGALDKKNNALSLCTNPKTDEIINSHLTLAAKIGVRGTPLFYIKGQAVDGFDQPAIENILKD